MNIDDSTKFGNMDDEPIEDYFDGIAPSVLKRRQKPSRFNILGMTEIPLIVAGIGLLVLIVLLAVFIPKNNAPLDTAQVNQMKDNLKQIEERLSHMETAIQKLSKANSQDSQINAVIGRVNALESDLAARLDVIMKKMDKQQLQAQTSEKEIPVKRKNVALGKSPTTKPTSVEKYHHIRSGETLYSISRKYGLTVNQLQKLNPSIKGKNIYPGQKLRIK